MFGRHFFEHRAHFVGRGNLKFVILDLLKDKPSHGYEIIRALEDRFHGFYSPSAGSVYPTLQLLEDMGHVTVAEQEGKKVYTITDPGRQFLKEESERINQIKTHMKDFWSGENREEVHETMQELHRLGRVMRQKFYKVDHDRLVRIHQVITKASHDIEDILR